MKVQTLVLGELRTNCYLLTQGSDCMLIDPADSADFILEKLQREGLNLRAIFATHGHFDHVLAVGELQLSVDAALYIDARDDFLIARLNKTAEHFLGYDPLAIAPSTVTHVPQADEDIIIESFSFRLIHVPGHTPGSIALYFPREEFVFTGDTLFNNAVGRTDLSYSRKDDLKTSLQKLMKLPDETIVYPGHGSETTIQEERHDY
ncbi:MAG: putative metallo-hydrolase [Microgenomates bacterium OLB23]|nr:MAG: putative metallo-hydrolase [Microgenomates bacterium OLB23]